MGIQSTVRNGSTMIVTLTLTSPSMFLLLPTGGSGMGFSFVLAPPGLLSPASMWRLWRAGRACCWRKGVCGGSFVWSATPVSLYSLRFEPNFTCYSVSFGPLAARGAPAGGLCCSGSPLLLRGSLFLL